MRRLLLDKGTVLSRAVGAELVVMDLRSSTYLAVSDSGAVMWPLLESGCTEEDLVAALVQTYGIEDARARGDVQTFVGDLDRRGLLSAAEG